MQIDMHYYGTYAMARAAGLSADSARTIATAAQYVDENVADKPLVFADGGRLLRKPTAHHLQSIAKNVDLDDQREVWVPFHFLPGGEVDTGEPDNHMVRLVCRKDSEIARQMVDDLIGAASGDPNVLLRAGVVAHVFADTYSHWGFSGVSSARNCVVGGKFTFPDAKKESMRQMLDAFVAKHGDPKDLFKPAHILERLKMSPKAAAVQSFIGEVGALALGHGSVATFPDRPYLVWGYEYEWAPGRTQRRDNPADFLDGCRALHRMFQRLRGELPKDFTAGGRSFADIEATVKAILAVEGEKDERSEAWRTAARSGALFGTPEDIPAYDGDAWTRWLEEAEGEKTSVEAMEHDACRFHLAANGHRSYVLNTLLPSRYLLVA